MWKKVYPDCIKNSDALDILKVMTLKQNLRYPQSALHSIEYFLLFIIFRITKNKRNKSMNKSGETSCMIIRDHR